MKFTLTCLPLMHLCHQPFITSFYCVEIEGPNLLVAFCSGCEDRIKGAEDENHDASYASAFREFNIILDGLANCVSCSGNGVRVGLL